MAMEFTPPESIFRCMPTILPLPFRRLLNAFAYTIDGTQLAYSRLREAALGYELPLGSARSKIPRSIVRSRVGILTDAWALIDQVSRARKIVSRFPWDHSKGPRELNQFIGDTKSATLVRNRLHQLDEDIHSRCECAEGHPTLGTVSWIDARDPSSPVRFIIASGPGDPAVETGGFAREAIGTGDVTDFQLRVCDQETDLEALHQTMLRFAGQLERALATSVGELIAGESKRRDVSPEELCRSQIADTTLAVPFRTRTEVHHRWFEVSPDSFKSESNPVAVDG